jgi:hypothetical protein
MGFISDEKTVEYSFYMKNIIIDKLDKLYMIEIEEYINNPSSRESHFL